MTRFTRLLDTRAITSLMEMVNREWSLVHSSFSIIVREMPRRACERALQAAYDADGEELAVFVTEWIGWSAPKFTMPILEILVEGNWREADDPIRYIRRAASRKAKQLACLESHGYLRRKPIDGITIWLPPDGLLLFQDSRSPLISVERRLDRELLLYRAGASEDVITIDRVRMLQIPRSKAAAVLGWERRRVEAAWKQHGRVLRRLDDDLQDYTPPY